MCIRDSLTKRVLLTTIHPRASSAVVHVLYAKDFYCSNHLFATTFLLLMICVILSPRSRGSTTFLPSSFQQSFVPRRHTIRGLFFQHGLVTPFPKHWSVDSRTISRITEERTDIERKTKVVMDRVYWKVGRKRKTLLWVNRHRIVYRKWLKASDDWRQKAMEKKKKK